MRYIVGLSLVILLLLMGFCLGATEFKNTLSGVTWTDVGTLFVTTVGFIFGFYTYFQWQRAKRHDDAYFAAKKYIASINEIEDYLHELLYHYNHICPAPGLMVENKDVSLERIEHLNKVWSYLYQGRRGLYKSHRELAFWNVSLVNEFTEDYVAMNKLLDHISLVSSVLNNQLFHFVETKMENMNEVINDKKRFDELYGSIYLIIQKFMKCSFKDIFDFDKKKNSEEKKRGQSPFL